MLANTIIFMILLTALPVMADDSIIIKPEPLRSERYQITDSTGSKLGSLKPDPLHKSRIQIIDRSGKVTGYIKASSLPTNNKKYDTFTPLGEHAGSIRQDPLRNDRYRYNGKTIRRDALRNDRWVIDLPRQAPTCEKKTLPWSKSKFP